MSSTQTRPDRRGRQTWGRRAAVVLTSGLAAVALAACGAEDPMAGHDMTPAPAPTTSGSASPRPGGVNDADVMFTQMMIPHHEQAVEMSDLLLAKEGIAPELEALAEQIKAAQQPEIDTMESWLQEWEVEMADHGQMDHGTDGGMMTPEDMQLLAEADPDTAQRIYLSGMIEHHAGAITMAEGEVENGAHPEVIALAESVIATQEVEIATMQGLLERS